MDFGSTNQCKEECFYFFILFLSFSFTLFWFYTSCVFSFTMGCITRMTLATLAIATLIVQQTMGAPQQACQGELIWE